MTGQVSDVRTPPEPEIVELRSVPGFVVFDLPGAQTSAGGTRLATDVTVTEVALLARAMTYKYAALGARTGGAKAGVVGDPRARADRAGLIARYCAEISPMVAAGRFLTGPDMGTFEDDFAPLREYQAAPGAMSSVIDDVPFEDLLTGYGVAVAAETALRAIAGGDWYGRSAAIEGFGKVGGGVAREVTRRGGRVVALSTVVGCVLDPSGLDIERLLELRSGYGDDCITHYGRPVARPAQLFTAGADVIVPGARPGVMSSQVARSLAANVRVVAPAANVPYTRGGAQVLRERGIAALPDFVCNAGAVLGYRSAPRDTPAQVLALVASRITEIISVALDHPSGPLAGACEDAAVFLRSWWGEPPPPPFAA
jgi:glutamate dehydrogenase (NAD(P)+)